MTSINTNVNALFAQSSLSANTVAQTTAMQQLSTGLRINSAKDDAAGLAITTRMNSNVRGLAVAIRNASDGISMAQTAESSLGSVVNMLQRMRELAIQSVNGTLTSQNRANMQIEVGQLVNEIDNISKTVNFNGIKLFDGSAASVVLQTNVSSGDVVKMGIGSMNSRTLGLGSRSALMAQGFDAPAVPAGSLNKAISSGDLVINGIVIGSSIASDDNASSTDKESSAIAKVAAINRSTSLTGVIAKIGQTVASGTKMTQGTAGDKAKITINGVVTDTITLKGNMGQDRNQAVTAINAISGTTGVHAVDTGSDSLGVQLVADDGRNIAVSFDALTTTFTAANVGINMHSFVVGTDTAGTDPISIFTGSYSLESTTNSPITVSTQVSGNVSNSGLSVGSFAPNTSYLSMTPRANTGYNYPTATYAGAVATVSFKDLAAGGTVTIDGLTFTATADMKADDVAKAWAAYDPAAATPDARFTGAAGTNYAMTTGATAKNGTLSFTYGGTATPPLGAADQLSKANGNLNTSKTVPTTLQAGDLVINGITIPASIAGDDTASDTSAAGLSLKEASAIAISAAVNKVTSQTGVRAIANPNLVVGSGFKADDGAVGTLYINNVAISIPKMSAVTKAIDVVNAINAKSGESGVVASDNGSGITLTAQDGRNISLATGVAGATENLSLANLGLVAPGSAQVNNQNPLVAIGEGAANAIVSYAGVTLVSDKTFTLTGGANTSALSHLAALGFQEGTYGGSNNGIKIGDMNIATVSGANDAIGAVDAALAQISDMRSNLGAIQNRLQSAIENLTSSQTNMQQSVSRIADTDYGTATTALSRAQIINQAATAMLAQANQQSQLVMQLLK